MKLTIELFANHDNDGSRAALDLAKGVLGKANIVEATGNMEWHLYREFGASVGEKAHQLIGVLGEAGYTFSDQRAYGRQVMAVIPSGQKNAVSAANPLDGSDVAFMFSIGPDGSELGRQ